METCCSSCLLPALTRPLETTVAAIGVTELEAHEVVLVIDQVHRRAARNPSPFPLLFQPHSLYSNASYICCLHPQPSFHHRDHFHHSSEARRKWRRPGLAETDAENSPVAGRMKILVLRKRVTIRDGLNWTPL